MAKRDDRIVTTGHHHDLIALKLKGADCVMAESDPSAVALPGDGFARRTSPVADAEDPTEAQR